MQFLKRFSRRNAQPEADRAPDPQPVATTPQPGDNWRPASWQEAQHFGEHLPLSLTATTRSVQDALETLNTLAESEDWLQIPVYLNRLPDTTAEKPVMRMWGAIARYRAGDITGGRNEIYAQATIAQNPFRLAMPAFDLLQRQMDVETLLAEAVAATRSGNLAFSHVSFALATLKHFDRLDTLENLFPLIDTAFASRAGYQLFRAEICVLRGDYDRACAHALRCARLPAHHPGYAVEAMSIFLKNPDDSCLPDALAIGRELLDREGLGEVRARVLRQQIRVCTRLAGDEAASAELARIAGEEELDTATALLIARSFAAKGDYDRARVILAAQVADEGPGGMSMLHQAGLLAAQARTAEALDLLETRVPSAQRSPAYFSLLGHILAWSGRIDDARPQLRTALRKKPQDASALFDMALCAELRQDYTLAGALMQDASVQLEILDPAPIMGTDRLHQPRLQRRMMFVAQRAGLTDQAEAIRREGVRRKPLSLPYAFREWESGDLAGQRVIIAAEMGIGDELRYASVYPRLLGEAAGVHLTCDPRLTGLFERSFPGFDIVPVLRAFPGIKSRPQDSRRLPPTEEMRRFLNDEIIEKGRAADRWVRAVHLFEHDQLHRGDILRSPDTPLLKVDPDLAAGFAGRLRRAAQGRKVIGLSWRGGRRTYSRDCHYFHVEDWRPILEQTDACFVNLQYAVAPEELGWLREVLGPRFIDLPELDLFDDMEGVAALCSQLDLTLSICTNVLELAGAVGARALYLMRSPQSTHAIRLHGAADEHGTVQDDVWKSVRIIPRFEMSQAHMLDLAQGYIKERVMDDPAPPVHAADLSERA